MDEGKYKRYFAFTYGGAITNLAKYIDGTAYLLNLDWEWEQDQSLAKLFLRGRPVPVISAR